MRSMLSFGGYKRTAAKLDYALHAGLTGVERLRFWPVPGEL